MPRRIALALSLAFTTIVTFSLVALGANAGFFSDAKRSATTQKARAADGAGSDDANAALRYLAAVADQTAQAGQNQPASPRIVTEYVYLYETPVPGAPRRVQPQTQAASTQPLQSPSSPSADDASGDRGGGASEDDGEQVPAPTHAAAPTSAAPTSTPHPAASPTKPAAQPTGVAPTPQPTSPPAQGACLDEFESRVTAKSAISGGNLVTWSNGIQTRVLDSTPHAAALQIGSEAHVHTTNSGACTVSEIELDN